VHSYNDNNLKYYSTIAMREGRPLAQLGHFVARPIQRNPQHGGIVAVFQRHATHALGRGSPVSMRLRPPVQAGRVQARPYSPSPHFRSVVALF
jgi:hypothetical protein